MNILIINGSPRQKGNTSVALAEIAENWPEGVGTDIDSRLGVDLVVLELYRLPLDMNVFEGRLRVKVLGR